MKAEWHESSKYRTISGQSIRQRTKQSSKWDRTSLPSGCGAVGRGTVKRGDQIKARRGWGPDHAQEGQLHRPRKDLSMSCSKWWKILFEKSQEQESGIYNASYVVSDKTASLSHSAVHSIKQMVENFQQSNMFKTSKLHQVKKKHKKPGLMKIFKTYETE